MHPNPVLNSDPACIAFRSLSASRFLGSAQRLGAGATGYPPPKPTEVTMADYKAPWGTTLKLVSWITTICFCIGAIFLALMKLYFVALALLIVLIAAALFTIRGYTINDGSLVVHRLFWNTDLPLTDLQAAEFDPYAMKKSWRTAGNGGLYSFTGYFTNKALGDFRAFVTNPALSVVLRFQTETVVVSPDSPEAFVQNILNQAQVSNP